MSMVTALRLAAPLLSLLGKSIRGAPRTPSSRPALLFAALFFAIIAGCGAHGGPGPASPAQETAAAETDERIAVDIGGTVSHLSEMGQSEVLDQLRDWAVIGTLAKVGLDHEQIARATVGQVPVRFPYLEELFSFEYGRGRRAVVEDRGKTRVLLFHDRDDPAPRVTLARLADRVRMETGEIPASFEVFEVDPHVEEGAILVARRPAIPPADLFGPAYGYIEKTITDQDGLRAWLDRIDDVTYARDAGEGKIVLGGRRFPEARDPGLSLEDVAALYLAHKAVEPEAERQKVDLAAIGLRHDRKLRDPGARLEEVQKQYDAEVIRYLQDHHTGEPGFSLDPHWRRETLAARLEKIAASPCDHLKAFAEEALRAAPQGDDPDAPALSQVAGADLLDALESARPQECHALRGGFARSLRGIAAKLRALGKESPSTGAAERTDDAAAELFAMNARAASRRTPEDHLVRAAVGLLAATEQAQCARYDGPQAPGVSLRGTRVGMVLFYTDLLAKLWQSVDRHRSAPTARLGFVSKPRLRLDAVWAGEVRERPATRIWFGPRRDSISELDGGAAVLFRHNAARVFAAGSDGTRHAAETRPAEPSRRAIGWWDRHFERVAAYEKAYELQSQIMKWSVLSHWLVSRGALPFLGDGKIPVRRDHRFDTWLAEEGKKLDLKYRHPIDLRPAAESMTGTECIDILVSYPFGSEGTLSYIQGGVGLAGKQLAAEIPRPATRTPPSLRHAEALAAGGAGGGQPGTAARPARTYEPGGRTVARGTPATRARWGRAEVDLGSSVTVQVESARSEQQGGQAVITVSAGSGRVARLHARGTPRGTALSLEGGEVHQAARRASGEVSSPPAARAAPRAASSPAGAALDALKKGEPGRARSLFEVAAAEAGAGPEARLGLALADLESGLVKRAAASLGGASQGDIVASGGPFLRSLPRRGLSEEGVFKLARGGEVTTPSGKLGLAGDNGSPVLLLRVDRPLSGTRIPPDGRARHVLETVEGGRQALRGDVEIFIHDRFSLNRQDLASQGEGIVGELARDPQVSWSRIDVPIEMHSPERIVSQDGSYRRVPREALLGPRSGSGVRARYLVSPLPHCGPGTEQAGGGCPEGEAPPAAPARPTSSPP